MLRGRSDADIHRISSIDPWFLAKLRRIIDTETTLLKGRGLDDLDGDALFELKQLGFSDRQIAWHTGADELTVRQRRHQLNVRAIYKTVDTCAAEFASATPYHYSTYEKPLLTTSTRWIPGSTAQFLGSDPPQRPPQDDDSRWRSQSDRTGH